MIQYAINHFVTADESTDSLAESTVHGDDSLHVWLDSDPTTAPADDVHEMPAGGWTWETDKRGFQQHPSVIEQYDGEVERRDPWETTLTEEFSQG